MPFWELAETCKMGLAQNDAEVPVREALADESVKE